MFTQTRTLKSKYYLALIKIKFHLNEKLVVDCSNAHKEYISNFTRQGDKQDQQCEKLANIYRHFKFLAHSHFANWILWHVIDDRPIVSKNGPAIYNNSETIALHDKVYTCQ